MTSKVCKTCGVEKSLEEFIIAPTNLDGRRGTCKECEKPKSRIRYQRRRERFQVTARATSKVCRMCEQLKLASDFYRQNHGDGLQPVCKVCYCIKRRQSYGSRGMRNTHYKTTYGLTVDDYDVMCARQGGCCAICGTPESSSKYGYFHVDHDHKTGAVRALLCRCCNVVLGFMDEDPERLEAAARYLRAFKKE